MNPHFIFNVLNSIKSYIYKNDKVKAASYLSDFSDLIRGILNMTNTQYVTLSEELAFLKIYVELEGMMLNDDFEFTVEIEDDLDLEHIELPSLLLQPFVENAFKHGLHHKAGKKNLLLSICKIENGVQIEITDNGVGREASKQINADRSALHQSFATSATEKRIELINREGRVHVNFAILDLENEAGTKVKIEIISTEE